MKVAVLVSGYAGLVVGTCLAESGNDVAWADVDEDKVGQLNRGETPIYEPGLVAAHRKRAGSARGGGSLGMAIVFIAVGSPSGEDGSADLQHVVAVAGAIGEAMAGETIVVDPLTINGDCPQARSFCYMDDEVEDIWRLFHSDRTEPTSIGNRDEFTVRELADVVLKETGSGSPPELRPLPEDDPKVHWPDITVAREVLGWPPAISLHEGIRRTVPYFPRVIEGGDDAEARTL